MLAEVRVEAVEVMALAVHLLQLREPQIQVVVVVEAMALEAQLLELMVVQVL
jgi:hypothetical protein